MAAVLLMLVLTGSGCAQPPAGRGFEVRYEAPAAADGADARFLRERRTAERAADALNAYLDLPYRVTLMARSCAGEGSGYDPQARRIELCYDDLAEDRALFEAAGRRPAGDAVEAVVAETVHHEAGHALVDALDLPVGGDRAEEDAADRFAALMLLREGPSGEAKLRTAAEAYELAAAEGPGSGRDEHAPPATRAAAHRCLLYGAAPDRHPAPAAGEQGCAPSWPEVRAEWERAPGPLLRKSP
ncbi:DUF4344 domain-containing metallopeptidase [Streptomyces sp. NPDC044571]|uniref:DUF4344 domain-containing metallopeptidase n=1 Tax=Streptomyces sp. NPDC044571 TaxID=3155371 RepID=UPI0033DC02F6